MWHLGPAWCDEAALARTWRAATPFPHLVVDDVVAADELATLFEILDDEAVDPYEGDILAFDATPPEPRTAAVREVRDAFARTFAPPLARITGKPVARCDLRAYAYRAGHYLLPHSDHQPGLDRLLAYAYYLPSPEPPLGGELELFDCELDAGELVRTSPARRIDPRGNRLVVFDVSDRSLHQVREVLGGLRISLAGWFYPGEGAAGSPR